MKTYRNRSHVRGLRYAGSIFLAIMGIFFLLISFLKSTSAGSLFVGGFFIVEAVFLSFLGRRMRSVSVSIDDDALIYRHNEGVTKILFNHILRLRFPSISYTGGWLKIESKQKSIRLTFVFERIDQLVLDLKDALDRHDMAQKYELNKLKKFYKTAVFAEQSWGRIYSYSWLLFCILVFLCCAGAAIGQIVGDGRRLIIITVLFSLISVLYGLIVYIVIDIVFIIRLHRKLKKAPLEPLERDLAFEKRLYTAAFAISGISYLLATAILLILELT